jgi:plasmid maintenance system antidote protein VapI
MAFIDAILTLHSQGWSQRAIARRLGVHRETVSRHVRLSASISKPAILHAGTGLDGDAQSAAAIDISKPANMMPCTEVRVTSPVV